jgi:PAS domain S-box-containing protein
MHGGSAKGDADGAETLWRAVFDSALEGRMLAKLDGTIVAVNPAACEILRGSERDTIAAGRAAIVVEDDAARRFVADRLRDGKARGRVTMRRLDGSTFTADVTSAVFVDATAVRMTSVTFRDVTELERARQALEILADAGRVLANSLDHQATLTNLTGLVVPRLADVCVVDLVVGSEVQRVAVAHRDPTRTDAFVRVRRATTVPAAPGGVDVVLRTGEPSPVVQVTDAWLRAATQDEAHFEEARALGVRSFVTTPLVARGRTIGALTLMSDGGVPAFNDADVPLVRALAERAALAIDNAKEHANALEARRLRDEVLGIVSHDLRNPLNSILINASVLARTAPCVEVDAIKRAVRRADRLILDLLLATKAESGRIELERTDESLTAVLDEVAALHRPLAEAGSITITASCIGEGCRATVDRHRVVQMLSNLVSNAIKVTPSGGRIELHARAEGDDVILTVADTGPGISPEELPHLFDRFWQGAHARNAGVGLGLAIARGVAEAHGGSIAVESRVGHGATFTVRMPLSGPRDSRA